MAGWSDELKNISTWNVPVCVVFGADDVLLKKDYLDGYAALWQDKVFLIDDSGHLPNIDKPEIFNDLLLQFTTAVLNKTFVNTVSD